MIGSSPYLYLMLDAFETSFVLPTHRAKHTAETWRLAMLNVRNMGNLRASCALLNGRVR